MIVIIIVILGILADQLSKFYLEAHMVPGESITIIKNILNFTYTKNEGAAFGMFPGARYFFIAVTFIACAVLAWWLVKNKNKTHLLMKIASGLIISGGIGNLIDRIFFGTVRDFIHFNIPFAIFNIADSCVTVGAVLLGIYIMFIHDKYMKRLSDAAAAEQQELKV